ncbi:MULTISPECIES: nucleoside/nucleotide kinase family protein [Streptomyces]|uniref:nucleoside/nucleotide kinase family protein n=1 Tax=Streptomyces TaxID=1883 RepID=UPI00068E30D3|nr:MULTISPECIES: nucleoside/nucleotide kinase family protein [Streptomyces]
MSTTPDRPPVERDPVALAARARELRDRPGRALLGLTGPPGAGKSTLGAALVQELGPGAALLPMDGFHLANSVLAALGRADRKGAPDTFDGAGYADLLRRLREAAGTETVYAPRFHREFEESYAAELAIGPDVRLVVTEGNYLLLPEEPWVRVPPLLDEVWYLDPDEELRLSRLVARHISFGRAPEQAHAWAHGTDQANAVRIAATRPAADLVVRPAPRE